MLYFVLFFLDISCHELLEKCNSSDFFDICKYLTDNNFRFNISVFNESQLDNDSFSFFMKSNNYLIFPAESVNEWMFL